MFFFNKRGQIYQIDKIDSGEVPALYQLVDLMNDEVPGHYYKEELAKAPTPNYKKHFFEVEEILKKKKRKNVLYYYVKYMFYPPKFNEWIPARNMKIVKS